MSETWRPIPDFPGYDVSDQGRVRSYYQRVKGGIGRQRLAAEPQRILNPSLRGGYFTVSLYGNNTKTTVKIHQLVMQVFVGPCPEGMEVCHGDGNPQKNHLGNLRYDTHQANMQEAETTGLPKGCISMRRFFTDEEALEIRHARAAGRTLAALAQERKVSITTISTLCLGKFYQNVGGPITT